MSLSLSNNRNNGTLHHSTALWSLEFRIKPVVFPNYFSNELLTAVMGVIGNLRVVTSATKDFNAAENLHFLWHNLLFVQATNCPRLFSCTMWCSADTIHVPQSGSYNFLAFSRFAPTCPLQRFSWKQLAWFLMGGISMLEHWHDSILKHDTEEIGAIVSFGSKMPSEDHTSSGAYWLGKVMRSFDPGLLNCRVILFMPVLKKWKYTLSKCCCDDICIQKTVGSIKAPPVIGIFPK